MSAKNAGMIEHMYWRKYVELMAQLCALPPRSPEAEAFRPIVREAYNDAVIILKRGAPT